jgi:hypothetical protein
MHGEAVGYGRGSVSAVSGFPINIYLVGAAKICENGEYTYN